MNAAFRILCLVIAVIASTTVRAQQVTPSAPPPAPERASDHINRELPRWLRVSGEYRVRVEAVDGVSFAPDNSDAYVLGRARLNLAVVPASWLKFRFQGQDAQVWGRNLKPDAPPFEDSFDLRQAYVEAGDVETGRYGLRVGRQEFSFGETRLIGPLPWANVARSFDAVRASYRRDKSFRVDAFAASVVNVREGEFNKRTDGNNLHGVYGSFETLIPRATVEPYVFWRVAPGAIAESGVRGKLNFTTIGMRWVGELPANFDYGMEVAGQTGSISTDSLRAFAGHWVAGYTVASVKTTPRFFAEYNHASGDRNPRDGRRGTFDQLYPTGHDKLGLADQVGWRNVEHGRAGVELKPKATLNLFASYHSWWLANAHDGLYNAAGTLVARVADGSAGRRVGQEADIQAAWAVRPQLQVGAGYAHVFPGAFLKRATSGRSHDFSYFTMTYLF